MSAFDDLLMRTLEAGGGNSVVFDPQKLAKELIAYGESEAATKLLRLGLEELQAIGRRASQTFLNFSGEHGPILDKAICLAVVEHVEGKPRDLKRKRRIYPKG
jgi:hypothetical protein